MHVGYLLRLCNPDTGISMPKSAHALQSGRLQHVKRVKDVTRFQSLNFMTLSIWFTSGRDRILGSNADSGRQLAMSMELTETELASQSFLDNVT